MIFDEWYAGLEPRLVPDPAMREAVRTLCWMAWEESRSTERERCADLCRKGADGWHLADRILRGQQ